MNHRKLSFFGQALALSISLTICSGAFADSTNYQVKQAGYVNSPVGSIEAQCGPGDLAVAASCEGDFREISVLGRDVHYALLTERTEKGFACKPRIMRYDQVAMLIIEVTCQAARTAN